MNPHTSQQKSAYRLATLNVPLVQKHTTVKETKKMIFNNNNFDSINYIYVITENKKLTGVVSIKELLNAPENKEMKDIMTTELVSVLPHSHQESIVHLALHHNLKAIPVLDNNKILQGVVLSDTILEVANKEMNEDIMLLEGIHLKEYQSISPLHNKPIPLLLQRIPWLFVGLLGGLVAAQIISFFESQLQADLILLSFLPLIIYISDATGSQSQTIFIRYIAISNTPSFITYLRKELQLGTLIAITLSIALSVITYIFYSPQIAILLGVSLLITTIMSICIAICIPLLLVKLHKDPAMGSGPFATIMRDLLSIVIYFIVLRSFYS